MGKKFLYIISSLLFFLIIVEIFSTIIFYFKDDDSALIKVNNLEDVPFAYYKFSESTNSFTKKKYLNPDGFASDAIVEKLFGKYRIVLIGGSVAEGLGRMTDSVSQLPMLQNDLNRTFTTTKIELFNAAIAGYTIEQQFILFQLYLKKYKPDMVIDLSGFNDAKSFKLNRNFSTGSILPPPSYRYFKVMEFNHEKGSFWWRFTSLFRSTTRTVLFINNMLKGKNQYDYSSIKETDLSAAADFYISVSSDIKNLAKAYGASYYLFLQPTRWYDSSSKNYMRSKDEDEKIALLYNMMEQRVMKSPYGKSITNVIDSHLNCFTDECHLNYLGNQLLSRRISSELKTLTDGDSSLISISF
jgi:lysophospholipase L1-like esterase